MKLSSVAQFICMALGLAVIMPQSLMAVNIDPPSRTFAKEGGSSAVLTSGTGVWVATTSTPWITLNRATANAGTSCLYTVSANFTAETRQGAILIDGNTHTVTQTGYPASLDPSFINLDKSAANGTLQVSTAAGVSWNAVSNVPWLSFSPASGSGPATISYSIQAYTGVVTRTGLATIAGRVPELHEMPSGCAFAVMSPASMPLAPARLSTTICCPMLAVSAVDSTG